MPVGHMPAQLPVPNGTQADPGAKPSFTQSASRLQLAQESLIPPVGNEPQKALPAVVRVQAHSLELLHSVCPTPAASQSARFAWLQVPVPWARHRFPPGFPVQMLEQHWR
jgi:hypothetical protein